MIEAKGLLRGGHSTSLLDKEGYAGCNPAVFRVWQCGDTENALEQTVAEIHVI